MGGATPCPGVLTCVVSPAPSPLCVERQLSGGQAGCLEEAVLSTGPARRPPEGWAEPRSTEVGWPTTDHPNSRHSRTSHVARGLSACHTRRFFTEDLPRGGRRRGQYAAGQEGAWGWECRRRVVDWPPESPGRPSEVTLGSVFPPLSTWSSPPNPSGPGNSVSF